MDEKVCSGQHNLTVTSNWSNISRPTIPYYCIKITYYCNYDIAQYTHRGTFHTQFMSCLSTGARFTKQTYNNFYPKFIVKQSYNVFYKKIHWKNTTYKKVTIILR